MKVKDLIELLKHTDPDMVVFINEAEVFCGEYEGDKPIPVDSKRIKIVGGRLILNDFED